mgnify:CR=1 FL=1
MNEEEETNSTQIFLLNETEASSFLIFSTSVHNKRTMYNRKALNSVSVINQTEFVTP